MGQAATQTGEGFDAIAGLGGGTDGRRGEIGSDEFAVGRQFARGSGDVAASQSVESAVAIGREVALDRGPSALGDGGGLDASDAAVREPEDEHLASDGRIGMGREVRGYGVALGLGDENVCHP